MMTMTVMMAVTVTVMMAVTVVTVVMTSARAMMVSVMAGGPGGGRASNESSHCQAHHDPESSHWLPPWRCGSMPCSTRMLDVGPIASPAEPAPPTASRQSRRATGTRYFNA